MLLYIIRHGEPDYAADSLTETGRKQAELVALRLAGLIDATSQSDLCFRPLNPKLEVGLNIVWKKKRIFSDAAEKFLERLKENFSAGE